MLSCYRGSLLCFCCLTLSKLTRFSFHDSQVVLLSLFWWNNHVKFQVVLPMVLEAFWDPERAQNRTQEAPKTLSGPGSRWTWFRVSFFACFGTPWDPGNGAPM